MDESSSSKPSRVSAKASATKPGQLKKGKRRPRTITSSSEADVQQRNAVYEIGETVYVLWHGKWPLAKIKRKDFEADPENKDLIVPCYLVHYPGFSAKYDEWVYNEYMMKETPTNKMKADMETKIAEERQEEEKKKKKAQKANRPKSVGKNRSTAKDGEESEQTLTVANIPESVKPEPRTLAKTRTARVTKGFNSARKAVPTASDISSASGNLQLVVEVDLDTTSVRPFEEADEHEELADVPTSRARPDDDFNLLSNSYLACDPRDPNKRTQEEEVYILQSFFSVCLPQRTDGGSSVKTGDERRVEYMEAMRKLSYISLAKRRKVMDETVLKVSLPPGLTRLLAHNYVQTVHNCKILKMAEWGMSAGKILQDYRTFRGQSPGEKSIYWQKACLAEADSLPKFFKENQILSFLLRHEWQLLKRKPQDFLLSLGPIHLTRLIQLMIAFHNQDVHRIPGFAGQQLMAIYEDVLQFMEQKVMSKLPTDWDSMYEDMSEKDIKRVKFVTFEKNGDDTFYCYCFHHMPDTVLEELGNIPNDGRDYAMKIVWKRVPNTDSDVDEATLETAGTV